jgi:hypothetical protein
MNMTAWWRSVMSDGLQATGAGMRQSTTPWKTLKTRSISPRGLSRLQFLPNRMGCVIDQ